MGKPRDRKRLIHQAITVLANPNYIGSANMCLRGRVKCTNMQIADLADVDESKVFLLLPELVEEGSIRVYGNGRARELVIVKPPLTIPDSMYRRLNKKNTVAKRTCLHCGDSFKSEWVGNRVCGRCKDTRTYKDASWAMI